jgi:hypothetical protein
MKPPREPTLEEKVGALQHVRYEVESLLLTPDGARSNKTLEEAVELARMVHSRALYTFFSTAPEDRKKDDMISKDFSFEPKRLYGDKVQTQATVDRFNKHLFHLTYNRVHLSAAEKRWPREEWLPPVVAQSKRFIDHILETPPFLIPDEERKCWQKLKNADTRGLALEQNTGNIAPPLIHITESPRRS